MTVQQMGNNDTFATSINMPVYGRKAESRDDTSRLARQSAGAEINVARYYVKYGPMVLRRCRKLLDCETAAQDALQDTFVNLLRHQHRLTSDAPVSLLYRMATNVCLNKIRSGTLRNEQPNSDLLQQIASAKLPETQIIAANMVSRLFRSHRESTRTIAVMHLLDGMTLQQVADEVGMSVSGVRKRLRPLRGQLTELVATL